MKNADTTLTASLEAQIKKMPTSQLYSVVSLTARECLNRSEEAGKTYISLRNILDFQVIEHSNETGDQGKALKESLDRTTGLSTGTKRDLVCAAKAQTSLEALRDHLVAGRISASQIAHSHRKCAKAVRGNISEVDRQQFLTEFSSQLREHCQTNGGLTQEAIDSTLEELLETTQFKPLKREQKVTKVTENQTTFGFKKNKKSIRITVPESLVDEISAHVEKLSKAFLDLATTPESFTLKDPSDLPSEPIDVSHPDFSRQQRSTAMGMTAAFLLARGYWSAIEDEFLDNMISLAAQDAEADIDSPSDRLTDPNEPPTPALDPATFYLESHSGQVISMTENLRELGVSVKVMPRDKEGNWTLPPKDAELLSYYNLDIRFDEFSAFPPPATAGPEPSKELVEWTAKRFTRCMGPDCHEKENLEFHLIHPWDPEKEHTHNQMHWANSMMLCPSCSEQLWAYDRFTPNAGNLILWKKYIKGEVITRTADDQAPYGTWLYELSADGLADVEIPKKLSLTKWRSLKDATTRAFFKHMKKTASDKPSS